MGEVMRPMAEEELLECLKKFCFNAGITISIDDIKFPKPPFITSVFQCFLHSMQINVDFIYTPPFKITGSMENTEWYEEIMPLISLKVLVSHMMQFSGITDLSMRDIIEPKPKRTKKILNYLIALWRYILIKSSMYEKLAEQNQAEMDQKQELANEIELTAQRFSGIVADIARRKEVRVTYKENQAIFGQATKSKDSLTAKYHKLKSKQADYLKMLRELDVQIESQKVKLQELDQKILKSPNRLDGEMEQLKRQILEVENKTKEIQSKSAGQKKLIGGLNDAYEMLVKSGESIRATCSISEQLREAATSLDLSTVKYKEEEENAKRMHIELEKEEEQKYQNEQWLAKENQNARRRIAAINEIMIMNKQECEKVESACERNQMITDELQKLLKDSEQIIASEKEQHQAFANKVFKEHGVLKKRFADYTDYLRNALESEFQKTLDPDILAKAKRDADVE